MSNSTLKIMVKIVGYKERVSAEGTPFMSLILQGSVEILESAAGRMYATARKTSMVSSFDEPTCKMLIGQDIPGSIEKVECIPFEYTNPKTGEVTMLEERWEYVPDLTTADALQNIGAMQTA